VPASHTNSALTRREFLLAFPFFWRRRTVSIAGMKFRIHRHGRSSRRYLWIHGDERTARDVLLAHLKTARGTAHLTTSTRRVFPLLGGEIDPNRMFSREGAEKNLRSLNPQWDSAHLNAALARLDRDRERFLRAILPPPGGLLVVVHNNSRGYSVRDEVPISDRVSLADPQHPNNFLLATDPADFDRLARSPFNVVLQNAAPSEDDGSLSRLAARRRVRYVNIEARLGDAAAQREMLSWLESHPRRAGFSPADLSSLFLRHAIVCSMAPTQQPYDFAGQLAASQDFFNRSTRVLEEADSGFRPRDGVMTVAQQVAHTAQTIDWFIEGASRPEGFDLDFEKHAKALEALTSLTAARKMFDTACANAIQFVRSLGPDGLAKPLPPGPIMGGEPVANIVWAMLDHTAHHRGALTVYSRLLGKVPIMPYGE
jgi:uncharacterized damage-inducible protein DinB